MIFVKRRPVGQSHIQLPGVNCSAFQPMATSNREKKHPANFYDGNSYVGCIRTVFVHKLNRHTFKKKRHAFTSDIQTVWQVSCAKVPEKRTTVSH